MHRIVVVGGGAGGLELATRLGDSLGKKRRAQVTLLDRSRTHLWKPLLHEVAAGSMDMHSHQLDYLAQARWHHFTFSLGGLKGLDRKAKEVIVDAVLDDAGEEILPERRLAYDTLVIAIGSQSNDFGTPGVTDHAFTLDNAWDAHLFHRRLVNTCFKANFANDGRVLRIVIVGAGATGVELSAELHNTIRVLAAYGLNQFDPEKQIHLTIVEAGPRILAGLPEYLAKATLNILQTLKVEVMTGDPVVAVRDDGLDLKSGKSLAADFVVWAAGVRASAVLTRLDELETNRINQLVVLPTLQTTRDVDIFSLGDCAACPWQQGRNVPPRAQSAHQQASHMLKTIKRRLAGEMPLRFQYRDFGSLVSLGTSESVGTLMGFVSRGSLRVEGFVAKMFYISLYKLHLWALHGFWRMALDTTARIIRSQTEPKVKLH
ncbi:MAG: NAD(P)/FAD-dependent oxidoreductase [Burkholderiales bacterium]|jgi:NADH dehydrogenase|nr:NAD(P)/FAD-dependent oxidoreductase [Betaproteobacteria bacterium]